MAGRVTAARVALADLWIEVRDMLDFDERITMRDMVALLDRLEKVEQRRRLQAPRVDR